MRVLEVVKLKKALCDEFVLTKHYSRRAPIFWAGFGLVENGNIEGVIVYGQPSPPIQKHAFRERDFRLYELSRLVVQTKTRNAASFLIANSLKQLEKPCAVISYADTAQHHCGIVYQATNWIYTGSTRSHDKMYIVDGKPVHPVTLSRRGITAPGKWAAENNISTIAPHEKHRYFFFNGSRGERKKMLEKLKYGVIHAYPKCDPARYDDGQSIAMPFTSETQLNFFAI